MSPWRAPQAQTRLAADLGCIEHAETLLAGFSSFALAAIMLIVVIDVSLRYAFNAPLTWGYDVISLYLVAAAFFLSLSDTLQQHGHIAVDILVPRLPRRLFHGLQSVGYALTGLVIMVIAWLGWQRLVEAYTNDETMAAIYPWPTWIAYTMLVLGCAVMAVRCLFRTAGHAASALSGQEFVETPPPPIVGHGSTPPMEI